MQKEILNCVFGDAQFNKAMHDAEGQVTALHIKASAKSSAAFRIIDY